MHKPNAYYKSNHVRRFCITYFLFFSACGGAEPKESANVVSVEDYESRTYTVEAGDAEMEGLLGTVTEDEMQRVFGRNRARLMKCYEDAVYDLEEIEGTVEFELEVPAEGNVESAFISKSDLGSIEAESCMLDIIKTFKFKRAQGGVAVLYYPMELEAPYAHPEFIPWIRRDVATVLKEHRSEVAQCLGGQKGIQITAYIGRGGQALSAGAAAVSIEAYPGAVCVAKALRTWTFEDPNSESLAKLSLDF